MAGRTACRERSAAEPRHQRMDPNTSPELPRQGVPAGLRTYRIRALASLTSVPGRTAAELRLSCPGPAERDGDEQVWEDSVTDGAARPDRPTT
jgi:hypothetical protein